MEAPAAWKPPHGMCWKQKPTLRTWPMRYARVEGKALNVYADDKDSKARGSSVADVTGCEVSKGVENWMMVGDRPTIILKRADLQGGGTSSFAFDTEALRDLFFEALQNMADGRDWGDSTASVIIKKSFSSNTLIEWMWGDAGTSFTRALAQKNPLRWTAGTIATIAAEMRQMAPDHPRPVDVRIKGRSQVYSFSSQADALRWLEQVQRPAESVLATSQPRASQSAPARLPDPAQPQPEPKPEPERARPPPHLTETGRLSMTTQVFAHAGLSSELSLSPRPLDHGDRYDSVAGAIDGPPNTPPRIHGDPEPPYSPAEQFRTLVRSASDPQLDELKNAARQHFNLLEEGHTTSRGRLVDNPVISPDDLDVTDDDRRAGFIDWHECAVSGEHIESKEGDALGFSASGAKGDVKRADWKRCLPVAIKKAGEGSTWSGDLTDEMRLFMDLAHPHVVTCYGILQVPIEGSSVRSNSIVTERCQTSLTAFLDDDRKWADLSTDEVDLQKYTILTHVSLGLQKLHDMSVLHRDIKCGNVLLDGEHTGRGCGHCHAKGRWKICDFGEAKVLKDEDGNFSRTARIKRGESDNAVTATIASPEMLNATNIGLPTDIYGFGMLMWEVMTRQKAWHWITTDNKVMAITNAVLVNNMRPKVPVSLSQACAGMIRRCLAQQVDARPVAKGLVLFFEDMRVKMITSIEVKGPVRESHMLKGKQQRCETIVDVSKCNECPKGKCHHWSKGGRFSIHQAWRANGEFHLKLVPERLDAWTELDRLCDNYDSSDEEDGASPEPEPEAGGGVDVGGPATGGVKPKPLGIVFRTKKDGKVDNHWPRVKDVKRDQVAFLFPEIQAGCTLLRLNESPVDDTMTFKDAVPFIQRRPATLRFSAPDKTTDLRKLEAGNTLSYMHAAAIQAGLDCVGLIREHEETREAELAPSPETEETTPLTKLPSRASRDWLAEGVESPESTSRLAAAQKVIDARDEEIMLLKSRLASAEGRLAGFEGVPPVGAGAGAVAVAMGRQGSKVSNGSTED